MSRTEFPRVVQLLTGHVSEDTAYVIESYPYGRLRTQKKVWIESATKGSGAGQQRIMEVTLNPKNGIWNKPKASTYCKKIYMYLDQQGHVQYFHSSFYNYVDEYCRIRYSGLFDMLPDSEKEYWNNFEKYLNIKKPQSWLDFLNGKKLIEDNYSDDLDECVKKILGPEYPNLYMSDLKQIYKLVKFERTKEPMELVYS